ncbi:Asp23/Gls24 family envelope stress response protein [Olsenella sp. HMSC062G07]|uniref:Asp23/Gls24 family envelope stress response protein n=1 Tax=Olsenella sp. HMSC062G07 TaxID=1739330 RepID=UPI00352E001A
MSLSSSTSRLATNDPQRDETIPAEGHTREPSADSDELAEQAGPADVPSGVAEPASSDEVSVDDEDLDSEDSLTFSNGVIEKIVAIAMHDVPGVIGMKGSWLNRVQDVLGASDARKGVSVEVTPDASVRVNISVLIKYGAYAPQVFEDVKKAVVREVSGMTGLSVAGVNLRIEDVLTPEEYEHGTSEQAALEPAEPEAIGGATAPRLTGKTEA